MNVRRILIGAFAGTALVLFPALVPGQTPDHRGEVTVERPEWRGTKASAPIPPELHVRNEGGSDGAGLCVISSVLANGRYQQVPGLGRFDPNVRLGQGGKDSLLWRTAKSRPGGYSPDKLRALVEETVPGEKYASIVGNGTASDFEAIERMSKAGYPIGMTMNTGALYGYRPIHHMVSFIHFRTKGWSCFVDNNQPGVYTWIPSAESMRRAVDMGIVWAWVWTRLPAIIGDPRTTLAIIVVLATATYFWFTLDDESESEQCTA